MGSISGEDVVGLLTINTVWLGIFIPARIPGEGFVTAQQDVLLRFSANWANALEGIVHSIGGRVQCWPEAVATDMGRPAGLQNSVVLLEPLNEFALSPVMSALDSFFEVGSVARTGTIYLFSVWPVPDLAAYGWVAVEQMPLLERMPGGDATASLPDLRISEGRSVNDLHHFEQVMIKGFPVPELEGRPAGGVFGTSLLADEQFRFWLGWQDEQPVSASAAYVAHGLVDLIFLATLPQARGRGFGSALARAVTLADHQPAMVIASRDGLPLYTRMGYRHLCDMPLWIRERP